MLRFLIATWPFSGDVYPQIALAEALRARGHEVAFYTGSRAKALIEAESFRCHLFEQVDEAQVLADVASVEQRPVGWRSPRHLVDVMRRWYVETIPGQVADLTRIITASRPDVLVTSPFVYAPFLVLSETLRLPVAISSTLLFPLVPGPDAPAFGPGLPPPRTWQARLLSQVVDSGTGFLASGMRRRMEQIRGLYGLPPLGCSVNAYSARVPLYLVPSVPELDFSRRDLPPSVHYVGPCLWNRPRLLAGDETAPLAGIPDDRPWVHVTEGTLQSRDPFLLRAAARGLAGRPLEAILTTGPQRDPSAIDLGPLAANVWVRQWVSHESLLPRCAVVVTTGGAGTVMAALRAGVPLVVVPTHWDKPDNARRVVEAGVGLRLAPQRCTPGRLRAAVERVLTEPIFRENARRLAQRLAGMRGPTHAAELLEQVAVTETERPPSAPELVAAARAGAGAPSNGLSGWREHS